MVQLSTQPFDLTARKFHQAACVLFLALAFVIGPAAGRWLVALIGLVLLAGRYWWPADIFRQLVWRVLEPAGLLRRREVQEDHTTRRVARVLPVEHTVRNRLAAQRRQQAAAFVRQDGSTVVLRDIRHSRGL